MKNITLKQFLLLPLFLMVVLLTSFSARAQLSGTKTIPGDYVSIAAFVTDLNANGVGAGGVTLSVPNGYTETAPAGGFVITATGTVSDQIIIQGTGMTIPVITASAAQVAGNLNDAIFKLVGCDYVTIDNLELRENGANTVSAFATNNMTEWGIALLYASPTDGTMEVTLSNNTILLDRTYVNTFGIYANATHTDAAPTTSATATGALGGQSGLKIYSNAISNVNMGIVVVGPTAAADHSVSVDIGGSSMATGNTITDFGTSGTFSSYANVSGTVNGILVRNAVDINISYNTVASSAGGTTAGTLRGIFLPSFNNAPTGNFATVISNNSISVRSGNASGTIEGISHSGTTTSATSTLEINANDFVNCGHTIAGASGTITFITSGAAPVTADISGNTFTNLTVNTTGSVTFISNNNTIPSGGTHTVSNNAIVTGFNKTGSGGTVRFYYSFASSTTGTTSIQNDNDFSNVTLTGTTVLEGWRNTDGSSSTSGPAKTFTGNTFTNIIGGSGNVMATDFNYGGSTTNFSNNTITNISGQGSVTGALFEGSNNQLIINANVISDIISTGPGGNVTGITVSSGGTGSLLTGNSISSVTSAGASANNFGISVTSATELTVSGNVISDIYGSGTTSPVSAGISVSGGTNILISGNKIYAISQSGTISTTAGAANGLLLSGGTTVSAWNNLIGDITAPNASIADAVRGIAVTSASAGTFQVYNNTIFLNATSIGANFGTSGIFHAASGTAGTASLDLRNNIIINQSASAGTGLTVAFRRSGTNLANYAATSDNNLFFAGTASASNLLLYDGTTSVQTLVDFQTAVSPRDISSIAGETAFSYGLAGSFFQSVTGGDPNYLEPVATITTQVESGGSVITSPMIDTDYNGVIRAGSAGYLGTGTNPDLGAYEFEGVTPAPVITLISVVPPTTEQCDAIDRLVSVDVQPGSGTVTTVDLTYSYDGVVQPTISMTNTSGTTWEATIPMPLVPNAEVTWSIEATNSDLISSIYTGTAYADEPLFGVVFTADATATPICAGEPTDLSVSAALNGDVMLGLGASTTSGSGGSGTNYVSPFTHYYGGYKAQYVIRSTELQAAGLAAGDITSLAFEVTSPGTTYNGFTLSIGATANTAASATFETAGLTEVYNGNLAVSSAGTLTLNFTSPFTWDGTSNLMVSLCWSNNNTGGTAAEVKYDATSFVSTAYYRVDSDTQAEVCGAATATSTQSNRPVMIFSGNMAPMIDAVSWSDGTSTVGTTNPLTVSPAVTTTYTATITAAGCTAGTTPSIMVTVIPVSAILIPVDASCFGATDGSFLLGTISCGTPPFLYSIDGGPFGAIPANLAAGSYSVVIEDAGSLQSSPVTVVVDEPDAVPAPLSMGDTTLCAGATSIPLEVTYDGTQTIVVSLTLPANESNSPPGTVIGTGTLSALPAGAVVTSVTMTVNDIEPQGNSWESDVRLGLSGAINIAAAEGDGSLDENNPFDYTLDIPVGAVNTAGGSFDVMYWDSTDDESGSEDAIFNDPNITITINYTVVGATDVTWWDAPSGGTQIGTGTSLEAVGTSVLADANVAGTYMFYAQGDDGTCDSPVRTAVTVVINELPSVDAGSDMAVCSGETVTLTGSGAASLSWDNGVMSGVPFTATATTTYTLTGTDVNGCEGTDQLVVTVFDLPDVSAGTDQDVCDGESITLSGAGAASYSWDNSVVDGVAFTPVATATYTVTGTDGNGCENTDEVVITVNPLPSVDAGTNITTCMNDMVTLSGSGAVNYSWDNGVMDGVAFAATTTTTYTVTGTDANGCEDTDEVVITVNPLPSVDAGTNQTVCENEMVTLSGSGAVNYTWSNGVMDGVAFAATVTTTYTVTGEDANGCEDTDQVLVTVTPGTTPTFSTIAPFCAGSTSPLLPASSTNGINGTWNPATISNTTSGTYTFTPTPGQCATSGTISVTVNALPNVVATDNADGTMTATPAGATNYTWNYCGGAALPGGNTQTVVVPENGSYSVTVTGTNGCTATSACITIDDLSLAKLSEAGFALYPNPTSGAVQVLMTGAEAQLRVTDANGKLLQQLTLNNGSTVDLSAYDTGVYFFHITTDAGTSMERIVKH